MKIKCLEELLKIKADLQKNGKKLVLCHGHFNVIHPGHLRILNFAKQQGDFLLVSVLNVQDIAPSLRNDFFSQDERALAVESLKMIDGVYKLPSQISDFIKIIKPEIYVKGREFEKTQDQQVLNELEEVVRHGGEVVFDSGEVQYVSPRIFGEDFSVESKSVQADFLNICFKHEIPISKLIERLKLFENSKILVLGDTIVDQFVGCDMLGVSSEAPVLAIRELVSKEFVGGAAIVAHHIKSLGADCTYLSVVGDDLPAHFVQEGLDKAKISSHLEIDKSRMTTFKIRYMVENQKILRVSRLKQHEINSEIEEKIIAKLVELIPQHNAVVISDFVYGVITKRIINTIGELSEKYKVKVFGDLQCSSQVGDVSKFQGIELSTPTEKEARIAMSDYTSGLEKLAHNMLEKTKNKNLVITLGAQGLLAYSKINNTIVSEFFPALETNPVDVAGAGDSMLSTYVLALCSGMNLLEASVLGACAAAITVKRIGNIPIKKNELSDFLKELAKLEKDLKNVIH